MTDTPADDRTCLVDALVAAVRTALGEMAGVGDVGHSEGQLPFDDAPGQVRVTVGLQSAALAQLVFQFPKSTAGALSDRILAETPPDVRAGLVNDCLCEFANVVAGQAKALLAETPFALTFSLPQIVNELPPRSTADVLSIRFESELGAITLHCSQRVFSLPA